MTRRHETTAPTEGARIIDVAAELDKEAKKRTRSVGAQAGSLFERLAELDAEERAELEASPEQIKAKYAQKHLKATAGASKEVIALVTRMRGEDDAGPESE